MSIKSGESTPSEALPKVETKETKEGEAMLQYFFQCAELYGELSAWVKKEGKREPKVVEVIREVVFGGKKRISEKDQQEAMTQGEALEHEINLVLNELDNIIQRLLSSKKLQGLFQAKLGKRIRSLSEASDTARELLAPFYEQYESEKDLLEKEGDTSVAEGPTADKEAAWNLTGFCLSDKPDSNGAQDERRKEWNILLDKLAVLPGSHRDLVKIFQEQGGDAGKALALLELYHAEAEASECFSILEFNYTAEDLEAIKKKIAQAREIISQLERVAPKEIAPDIRADAREANKEYQEMKVLFKDNFFGMEQAEQAFTLQDGTKLIDLSPEQKQEAIKLLYEKLNEPDIKIFMEKVKSGEIEPKDWMLVFRTDKLADGSPLTMKAMQDKLAPDMRTKGQGKLLFDNTRYQNEAFYTEQKPANMHWQLTTVVPLENTKGKNHADQEPIRVSAARQAGLNPVKTRRRTPVETIYDSVIFRRTKNQSFLPNVYDGSDVRSSDGNLVVVGYCGAEGASVNRDHSGYRYDYLRVSLSR